MDGGEGFGLDQFQGGGADQFQQGQEGDHHPGAPLGDIEEFGEQHEATTPHPLQDQRHPLAQGQRFLLDPVAGEQVRPRQQATQGHQHLAQVHLGRRPMEVPGREFRMDHEQVALQPRQIVQVLRRLLEAFVFHQPADQLGARVTLVLRRGLGARQEHARLDLGQHGGHHQILGGQFEAQLRHQLHVLHVLVGDDGDRDMEDIQVLALDQVQQQVQRPLEGVEKDLQGIRRDVEVLRQGQVGLALDQGERQLLLGARCLTRFHPWTEPQ